MVKKDTEVVVQKQAVSIESVIQNAIDKGVPVETMEKLLAMRRELKSEAATEAYTAALGQFQRDMPVIKKTKQVMNKDGATVRYQYAPLDAIVGQIKKELANNELSYSWDVRHTEGHMDVTCKITHVMGHSETSTLQIPIDKEGFMTAPQKYASAQTFAKRYTLLNALGITTADEDTDATDVGKEKGAKSDKAKIIFLLKTLKHSHKTKEDIETAVTKLTKLPLEETSFGEIISRLETLVAEQHEGNDVR